MDGLIIARSGARSKEKMRNPFEGNEGRRTPKNASPPEGQNHPQGSLGEAYP